MIHFPARPSVVPEPLEPRLFFSSSFPNVNISRMTGGQAEGAIAVDPTNPLHLFIASNLDEGDGLLGGISTDGGATWTHKIIANDQDGLEPACCDPSAAYDSFGNLFLSYLNADTNRVIVVLSTNGGASFTQVTEFKGDVDQPTITTGPGSVWVTFAKSNSIVAAGAQVAALGSVGTFTPLQKIAGSGGGNFGDVAVGAAGQVMVTFQKQSSSTLSKIYVSTNPGGVASAQFGKSVLATTSHVGNFDYINAEPDRGIDAEAGLAFDRSSGAFSGRVYLVYTDENPAGSGNTDIFLRYSDTAGSAWSDPVRVNDDLTLNSQFMPRMKVDSSTGIVGVSWYDSRNDLGTGDAGDTNMIANDDAQIFATIVTPGTNGLTVSPNQQVSAGTSNAAKAFAANRIASIDFGDYTGLDFLNGTLHPLWFDNSNSTADNPNGPLKGVNPYTASVPASSFAVGNALSLGGLANASGPVAALSFTGGANVGSVKKGNAYAISVTYADPAGVNTASIGDNNLLVTGPNGFSVHAGLQSAKQRKDGVVLATYRLVNPDGKWELGDAGVYAINLVAGQVLNATGGASEAGILGTFAVAAGLPKGSHGGSGGPRHHGGDPDDH